MPKMQNEMKINTLFDGRIFQVTEALDYGDAVSNQIIALDGVLKKMGFDAAIFSKWHHEEVAARREYINALRASDKDIVIYHCHGFSEFTLPHVLTQNCTRIILYHNITPHEFFDEKSSHFDFCYQGRKQLQDALRQFHFFWADSEYNLNELKELGAPPSACAVIPIIVPPPKESQSEGGRDAGTWLFLGRIAANKRQIDLVNLFAELRKEYAELAKHLFLVGGYSESDPYFRALRDQIKSLNLQDSVSLIGKVSDDERDRIFERASIYVSMSAHEGFGVPLIEAPLRGLPVAALNTSAIGETMGGCSGLASDHEELKRLIILLLSDRNEHERVLNQQRDNAQRFSVENVGRNVGGALGSVLPKPGDFKTVSIVICTYNRRDYLERCLDYLRYQTCKDFEVVVVDGPSDDGTKDVLSQYQGVIKIAHNPERNLSKSRNIGIELADGDIVAFIDDDAIPFDDWVETILMEYGRRPIVTAGLGGPAYYAGSLHFQAEDIGFNDRAETILNIDSNLVGVNGWTRSLLGTNSTFKRSALSKANGFDEQFDYFLDESELCFRFQKQGHLVAYVPDLYLRHEFAQSHNRSGKYNYNWFTICKNTAYFVAAYSGLQAEKLRRYLADRIERERVVPLDEAVIAKELQPDQRNEYVDAIWRGVEQGLVDAQAFPRTRQISAPPGAFKVFPLEASYNRVTHEIKRLHVCILSKEFPPFTQGGGIGTLYYHLVSELLLMGHEITVVVPSTEEKVFSQGRFRVVFAKNKNLELGGGASTFAPNLQWSLNALHALAKIHLINHIDVLDTALWDTEALAFSLLTDRPPLVLRLVTPFLVAAKTNQWEVDSEAAALFSEAERTLLRQADAVVPISEAIAQTIAAEYNVRRDGRWNLSHCGVAYWPFFDANMGYSEFQEFENIPQPVLDSGKLVVFVGRLERRKGIDLLMQAARRFLTSDLDVQLIIAGRDVEGWTQRCSEILPGETLDRIHFLGEVADATRDKLLAKAYCLVFPSRYESFGLVPLEAFVHGVPVIASRSGAIPEVVEHEKCGLLFDPENPDSLADCVVRLLGESELRQRLSDGAAAQIRRFSSRQSAIKAVDIYKNLIVSKE
jgi:glycosyltransferase involved in cell wall biosynthesis